MTARASRGRVASGPGGTGLDVGQVLDQEELGAVGKGRGVGGNPVVRATPRQEAHLTRVARVQPLGEVVHQRPDRVPGQRLAEELRFAEESALLGRLAGGSLAGWCLDGLEPVEVPLRLPVGHVPVRRLHGLGAYPGNQVAEEFRGLGLPGEHHAEDVGQGRPRTVTGRGQPQGGVELAGAGRRPGLPGLDRDGRMIEGPDQVEHGGRRRRQRAKYERRDHAEVAATGTAQRPEQFLLGVLAGLDDPAVRQDDLCPQQVIAGQAVLAAEDPDPASEREAGDPDGGTAAGGDRPAAGGQRVVEISEPRTGTDRRHVTVYGHRAHRCHVDDDPLGRGVAGDRVPATADRGRLAGPPRKCDRRGDIRCAPAPDDGPRSDVLEARHRWPANRLVGGRARQNDIPRDSALQRLPVSSRVCHGGSILVSGQLRPRGRLVLDQRMSVPPRAQAMA